MDKRLESIVEILESWAEGQLPLPRPYCGICSNLDHTPNLPAARYSDLVAAAAESWSGYSGDGVFPVPHERVSPESAYTATYDVPKWGDDAYGQARRRLCQHVANWVRANPEAAAEFLRGD